ncbi:Trigger factor [Nymphon striatum]|nr:Trigger factor [Nymphon striatum]
MQVTETLNEGLKREIKIVVAKEDMTSQLEAKLETLKGQVKLNGFRQGKVPKSHLQQMYGKQAMAEIVNEYVSTRTGEVLKEREERAAQQPEINMTEDEKEAEEILAELEKLKLTRPVAEVSDKEVDEQIEKIGDNMKPYEEKKGKAAKGDRVNMNYLGKIDGEPFEGGADNDAQLVIGSGQFIPGFEDQLTGTKAGDETVVKPGKLEINDEFATKLGMENVEKLKEAVRGQIEGQYTSFSRAKIKREILDTLDKKTKMELPEKMVEQEFSNIWTQMNAELEKSGKTFKDEGTTEAKAKKEYQTLAERRVRLGLVLAEIGEKSDVQVTDDEMQAAENPDAVAGLRAPLYEDKVIDFILEKAEVKEKKVSKDELMKEDDDEA